MYWLVSVLEAVELSCLVFVVAASAERKGVVVDLDMSMYLIYPIH